ncbi:hypothetical protein M1145_01380 [Patescibacteria group bacterium]|nr:hypothetical protein [Patescibacteria group bacterium]
MIIEVENQLVISKEVRQKIKDLGLGKKVKAYSLDNATTVIKVVNTTWLKDNYGIVKKIWKDIDSLKAVKKMRKELI